jgi:hypothetical protein
MATRKQRAANRRNAQLSTGPKTPEGKAAVRLNALKHGLTAENAIINGEDEAEFDALLTAFLEQSQPAGPLETALVHQIVMAQWQLARCRGIETGLFELGLFDLQDDEKELFGFYNQPQKLAHVFRGNTDTLSVFGRYHARIERSFFRALHELQRLQAARRQPDPPPASKTISAEQTQSAPEAEPNPLPQNGLTPAAMQNGNAQIDRSVRDRRNGHDRPLRIDPAQVAKGGEPLASSFHA